MQSGERLTLETLFEAGEAWGRQNPYYDESDDEQKAAHDAAMRVAVDECLQLRQIGEIRPRS
jgi:hypothetical protein